MLLRKVRKNFPARSGRHVLRARAMQKFTPPGFFIWSQRNQSTVWTNAPTGTSPTMGDQQPMAERWDGISHFRLVYERIIWPASQGLSYCGMIRHGSAVASRRPIPSGKSNTATIAEQYDTADNW